MYNGTIYLIGLGNAGIRTVEQVREFDSMPTCKRVAIDTDRQTLDRCKVPIKIEAGFDRSHGNSCAGVPPKGERSLAMSCRKQICDTIQGGKLLLLTAGLGGWTGTGGAIVVPRVAQELNIPCLPILSYPLICEGMAKMKIADEGIRELKQTKESFVIYRLDDLHLSSPSQQKLESLLQNASRTMAGIIAEVLMTINTQMTTDSEIKPMREIIEALEYK
jgi:cell division protein FtsZ